jgi:flagellar hook-associated protein 3 FlgL
LTETLSSINDIDVAEKAIELQTAQLAYMASLQVGTKLMQTTILDYV